MKKTLILLILSLWLPLSAESQVGLQYGRIWSSSEQIDTSHSSSHFGFYYLDDYLGLDQLILGPQMRFYRFDNSLATLSFIEAGILADQRYILSDLFYMNSRYALGVANIKLSTKLEKIPGSSTIGGYAGFGLGGGVIVTEFFHIGLNLNYRIIFFEKSTPASTSTTIETNFLL